MSQTDLENNEKKNQDTRGIIVLLFLYTVQGIAVSFFNDTIKILLMDKGANMTELGIFSMSGLPYSFKFLLAPCVDAFYFRRWGKRKSYIVPILYIHSALSVFYAYRLEENIQNIQIMMLTMWAFLCTAFMAIQDIAVDSWVLTLLSKQGLAYGAMAQTVGLTVGRIIAVNLFIPLNSVGFCNEYINTTPSETPVITMRDFWIFNAVIVFGFTFYIHAFVKEKVHRDQNQGQPLAVASSMKYFYQNPNLKKLTLISLTQFIPIAPISSLSGKILMEKGLSKEIFANLSSICIPFQLISSFFVSSLCQRNLEMRVRITAYVFWLCGSFTSIFVVSYYDTQHYYFWLGIIIGIMIIETTTSEAIMIASLYHANKICDESVSGTFITTRNSIQNFGFIWPSTISFHLAEIFPWRNLSYVGIILGIPYVLWMKSALLSLEGKTSEDYFCAKPGKRSSGVNNDENMIEMSLLKN